MAAVVADIAGTADTADAAGSVAASEVSAAPFAPRAARRAYWQAQGIAELSLSRFVQATEADDRPAQRRAFYLLANYYGRTRSRSPRRRCAIW
jgi:hypothetical protein